jgi:hypothetical protein
MFNACDIVVIGEVDPFGRVTDGGENCPVVTVPIVFAAPVLKIFIPSELDLFRSTLAKRTFRRICGGA